MEIKEMIEVLKAFEEGKEIESKLPDKSTWNPCPCPIWDFYNRQYRIKPQPNYIPFTWEDRELFRGKWIRLIGDVNEHMINFIGVDNSASCARWKQRESLISLFETHEFIDGTPFGKLS